MSIELVPYPFRPTNIVRPAVPRCGGRCFNYDVRYGALKFRVEVSGKLVRMVDVDEPSYEHIFLDPSDPPGDQIPYCNYVVPDHMGPPLGWLLNSKRSAGDGAAEK